jgi:hypothetical protein
MIIAFAEYALAALRNFRQHVSDPCTSVAKKILRL